MPRGADYARRGCGSRGRTSPDNPALWTPPGFSADAQRRAPRSSSSTRPASSNRTAWNAPVDDRGIAGPRARCSCAARRARSTRSARSGRPNTARRPSAPSSPPATMPAARSISPIATCSPPMRQFLRQAPADRPIILAAHSQGSLHLMRLLQERIARRARGGADRRRLCDRLAGLGDRGPARPALPRLRAARAGALPPLLAELRRARRPEPGHRRLRRDDRARRRAARGIGDALHQPADRRARRRAPARTRNLGTLDPQRGFDRARASAAARSPARCDAARLPADRRQ